MEINRFKTETETGNTPENLSPRAKCGAKIEESLLAGNEVEDLVLVTLIANCIRETNEEVESGEWGGWILDDFPRTKNQAQLLEKELTG